MKNPIFLSISRNQKHQLCLLCTVLSLAIIAGCGKSLGTQEIQTAATITATSLRYILTPTVTKTPSLTNTSTQTTTPISTPTLTSTPEPTSTPVPLSQMGPWIIYSASYYQDVPPKLCNLNVSGCVLVKMPDESWGSYHYPYIVSPKGGYLALLAYEGEHDPQIWIVKLPEQTIVRKIPLISNEIRSTLPKKLDPSNSFYYSLTDQQNVRWSPNGQYVAFVAALKTTNSDLYVYDVANDSIRQLSSEEDSVRIIGWSPDNTLIVYAQAREYEYYYANDKLIKLADVGLKSSLLDSWSLDKMYSFGENEIAGWTSESTFIIFQDRFKDKPHNIREVNIYANRVKTLIPGSFGYMDLDETTGTIFLIQFESKDVMEPDEIGVFRIDPQTGVQDRLLSGDWIAFWSKPLNALIAAREKDGQIQSILFASNGRKIKEYKGWLSPSPNGEWLLISDTSRWLLYPDNSSSLLYNNKDELLVNFVGKGYQEVMWLQDSSGFFGIKGSAMYFHTEENDWQGILAVSDFSVGEIIYP